MNLILYIFNFWDLTIIIYFYLFVYNITLLIFFLIFLNISNVLFKTIYSFTNLYLDNFLLISLTFVFFSLAGIPPFIGFFSKLLLLLYLINSNFFFMYFFFFILILIGLYFYLQNIKFLYSIKTKNLSSNWLTYFNSDFFFFVTCLLNFLILGNLIIYDFLIYFTWLLC